MVIANKGDKNNQNVRDYTLYYSSGSFGFRVGNGTTSSVVTGGTVSAGQWYTVVAWHNAVGNTLNIQVNNGAVNIANYSGGAMDTTFPLVIGAHSDGTFGLDGRIDELALYKRVLTPSERAWFHNGNGSGRAYADLTAPVPTTTTTLAYDNAGRKTSMVDPDMGTWTYTYDALSNLKTQTDARGCVLTLGYDNLSRLTSKTSTGSCGTQVNTSYTYDSGANAKGQRTGMTDLSGSTTWTYDARGRMLSENKALTGAGTFLTSWTYNAADMPITMTYPGGEVVTYGYNSRMLLNSVTSPLANYVSSTGYDPAGRMTSRALGNTLTQSYTYYGWDEKVNNIGQGGRLKNLTVGSLQNLAYTYDAGGNISTILDSLAGPQTQAFGYDALDRLTSAVTTGGSLGLYNETYTYDSASGNLATKAGVTLSYNDAAHKHAVTSAGSNTYSYDLNGNQTTRVVGGQTFNLSYDAENRLVSVSGAATASFVYDGDGRRVKATVSGTTTYFVGPHYELTGSQVTKYYFAATQRVAMRKYTIPSSMVVEYLLGDHLGSTSITTNTAGAKVSEMRYKPWGEIRSWWTSGLSTTPAYKLTSYTFTGQYSYMDDPSTTSTTEGFGLLFYNARMYDPAIGRFTSADSIVPGGVQGVDRYAYVNNSPINYVDPSGHMCSDPDDPTPSCDGSGGYPPNQSPLPIYSEPDQLDESLLHDTPKTHTGVSGLDYYRWYRELWNNKNWWWWQSHTTFTVWDFITLILYIELAGVGNPSDPLYEGYERYREGAVRAAYEWCEQQGCDASTPEGALNWIAAYSESAANRYFGSRTFESTSNPLGGALLTADSIRDPAKFGNADWSNGWSANSPYGFGNVSLFNPRNLSSALSLNMISWISSLNDSGAVVIPTGCGSMLLHDEKTNYEWAGCGNGKWPLN